MPAVLVTGASTGIGASCALHLDSLGHHVFAGVRTSTDGDRLREQASDRLETVMLDVTDEKQIAAAADLVEDALGTTRFAGVVNNAGIAIGGPVEYLPLDYWRRQFEVNVIGQVAVTQAFMPLIRKGVGRIVFMGSISGRFSNPMMAPYAASKHAIEAIGEAMRHELHEWGIHVSVVEPGAIKTAIWDKGRSLADELEAQITPEAAERYAKLIALVRRGIDMQDRNGIDPIHVAKAVEHALFSEHPKARYPVGIDARATALVARWLPDPLRDAVVRVAAARI